MTLPAQGVSEVALEVSDMDRAVSFWTETLGFPIVDQWGYADGQFTGTVTDGKIWATWIYVGGNTRVGLWLPREFADQDEERRGGSVTDWPGSALYDEGGEHVHFALYVDETDFDDAYGLLQQKGVSVTEREFAADAPYRSMYFKDPDEHVIELYTRPMKDNYQLNPTG
ncbi:VOC family protein [Natrinema gelatinilyticum]|uniref:VOC family protein n=1 Tax=Natrinema gelatinilyticum TaxID=2961571 RepID=UPI002115B297|nr:VOC family protein [Natrinema gelatinilyticum]